MSEKSKLVLFVNADAIGKPANPNRPAIKAIFRREGEAQDRVIAFPFAGIGKNGAIYARGQLQGGDLRTAIAVRDGHLAPELPGSLDLKYGEAVLFESRDAAEKNKSRSNDAQLPVYYGFLHDGADIVRLAAWHKPAGYFGEVRTWTKGQPGGELDQMQDRALADYDIAREVGAYRDAERPPVPPAQGGNPPANEGFK